MYPSIDLFYVSSDYIVSCLDSSGSRGDNDIASSAAVTVPTPKSVAEAPTAKKMVSRELINAIRSNFLEKDMGPGLPFSVWFLLYTGKGDYLPDKARPWASHRRNSIAKAAAKDTVAAIFHKVFMVNLHCFTVYHYRPYFANISPFFL